MASEFDSNISKSILCGEDGSEKISVLRRKGVEGLQRASLKREDGKEFNESYIGASIHENCRTKYISPTCIKAALVELQKKKLPSAIRTSRSSMYTIRCQHVPP